MKYYKNLALYKEGNGNGRLQTMGSKDSATIEQASVRWALNRLIPVWCIISNHDDGGGQFTDV